MLREQLFVKVGRYYIVENRDAGQSCPDNLTRNSKLETRSSVLQVSITGWLPGYEARESRSQIHALHGCIGKCV